TYLMKLLAENGFELLSLDRKPIRMDRGEAIAGLIVVARRANVIEVPVAAAEDETNHVTELRLPN
ncbi:MAG: hypothetical protein KDJ43_09615, partial [Rhizobiaceae bacterium]|nr:hypothetical protein [Rhizobiaceae bacterium]